MSQHIASIIGHCPPAEVRIYETDPEPDGSTTYYWCCEKCGACSPHFTNDEETVNSAVLHEHRTEDTNA